MPRSTIQHAHICLTGAQVALGPLVKVGLALSKLQEFTGRTEPTVIT